MENEIKIRTYEELLMSRVGKAFDMMDIGDVKAFDEVIESIKMLMKLNPDAHAVMLKWDAYFMKVAQKSFDEIDSKCSKIEDDYVRDTIRKRDEALIEWGFRKDILEATLNIINDFKMLPFSNPVYASIETEEPAQIENRNEPEPPEEPEPEPEPQKDELKEQYDALRKEEEAIKTHADKKIRFFKKKV